LGSRRREIRQNQLMDDLVLAAARNGALWCAVVAGRMEFRPRPKSGRRPARLVLVPSEWRMSWV
jgi:hypothetical protein